MFLNVFIVLFIILLMSSRIGYAKHCEILHGFAFLGRVI